MGSECSAESETGRKIKTFGEVFMERKNTAIVLAAGQGKRMNSKVQKQFLELGGKTIALLFSEMFPGQWNDT